MAKLEDIRKKREGLQAELDRLMAVEKAEAETALRKLGADMLAEIEKLGYNAWTYEADGEDGLKIRVNKKRSPASAKVGQEIIVKDKDGNIRGQFKSGAEAVRTLGIETPSSSFSAPRLLESKGFTVEYVKADKDKDKTKTEGEDEKTD